MLSDASTPARGKACIPDTGAAARHACAEPVASDRAVQSTVDHGSSELFPYGAMNKYIILGLYAAARGAAIDEANRNFQPPDALLPKRSRTHTRTKRALTAHV